MRNLILTVSIALFFVGCKVEEKVSLINGPEQLVALSSSRTIDSVKIEWEQVRTDAASYIYKVNADSAPTDCDTGSDVGLVFEGDVDSLSPSTDYFVRVCMISEEDVTSEGVVADFRTLDLPPANPTSLAVDVSAGTTVTFEWTGSGIRNETYKVVYSEGATAPADCTVGTVYDSSTNSSAIYGFKLQTDYSFRVCAVNANPIAEMSSGTTLTFTSGSLGNMSMQFSQAGASANVRFGYSAHFIPDFDGDGIMDFTDFTYFGAAAAVYSGQNGSKLLNTNLNGSSVAYFNNYANNNGTPSLAIGAMAGSSTVVDAGDLSVQFSTAVYANAGSVNFSSTTMVNLGDLNGDGFEELAISNASPNVSVYSGSDNALLKSYSAPAGATGYGYSIVSVGDVNKDGTFDYAVSASQADANAGRVYVYSGLNHTLLFILKGSGGERLGVQISKAGDVNKDGYDDIAVSAPYFANGGTERGRIAIFSGKDQVELFSAACTVDGCRLGEGALSFAGDFNGDTFPDIAVSSFGFDGAVGADSGKIWVYSGKDFKIISSLEGALQGSQFGYSIDGGVDYNGDGKDDIIVGAQLEDVDGLARVGKVYIFSQELP